jgi:hypothetical protein
VPGLTIDASPNGNVDVQPDGSSLAEPLNGPASVSVRPGAPTIFRPGRGASVQLSTRLRGGRSAVLTITGGAVEVSQPGGQSTRIVLLGDATKACPRASGATAAYFLDSPRWRITSRGNAHPHAVHGKVNLYFRGTDVRVRDVCRAAHGLQKISIVVFKGVVDVNGVAQVPGGSPTASPHGRVLMILHGRGSGRFRTHGHYASGTVLG